MPERWQRLALLVAVSVAPALASQPVLSRLVGSGDVLWPSPVAPIEAALSPRVDGDYVVYYATAFDGLDSEINGVWLWDGETHQLVIDSSMPDAQAGELGSAWFDVDAQGMVAVSVEGHALMGWRDGALFPILSVGEPPPNGPPGAVVGFLGRPVVKDGVVYVSANLLGVAVPYQGRLYEWTEELGAREVELPGSNCCPSPPAVGPAGELYATMADPTLPAPAFYTVGQLPSPGAAWQEYFSFGIPFPGGPPGAHWSLLHDRLAAGEGHVFVLASAFDLGTGTTVPPTGLYRLSVPDQVEPILLIGDADPGTGQPITTMQRAFSADGERLAMISGSGPTRTLVSWEEASGASALVVSSEGLDGQPVAFLQVTIDGLSGDLLAFEAWRGASALEAAVWLADFAGPPPPGPLEVPTLGGTGLAILATLLAGAGLWVRQARTR